MARMAIAAALLLLSGWDAFAAPCLYPDQGWSPFCLRDDWKWREAEESLPYLVVAALALAGSFWALRTWGFHTRVARSIIVLGAIIVIASIAWPLYRFSDFHPLLTAQYVFGASLAVLISSIAVHLANWVSKGT